MNARASNRIARQLCIGSLLVTACVFLAGCYKSEVVIVSGDAGVAATGTGGYGSTGTPASTTGTGGEVANAVAGSSAEVISSGICSRGGLCRVVPTTVIDKLDLLFVIDSSSAMDPAQQALRDQLYHLIVILSTGDPDGNGTNDFPPARDFHFGVIDTDMGLPSVDGVADCAGLGKDGVLQHVPGSAGQACQAASPQFLSFVAGVDQPQRTAQDVACITQIGTAGCGVVQPLEAALKALWPSVDPMAAQNGGVNRITFASDPATGLGILGHGDTDNAGFLRNDPVLGPSVLAVIVLSNGDDCSASDTKPFTPAQQLSPSDPLVAQGGGVRCHYNKQALHPVERYVNGLKALRPGHEDTILFAAIAGVPRELVDTSARSMTNFADSAQRKAFYERIANDPRVQEAVDAHGTADPSDDTLSPSCSTVSVTATPPTRLVQTAQAFGEDGIVQSICEDDLGPAVDTVAQRIMEKLGQRCLPAAIPRGTDGQIACDVLWELPPPGRAPADTPIGCGPGPLFGFLLSPGKGRSSSDQGGGAVCRVPQLAVKNDPSQSGGKRAVPTATDGSTFTDGWYYDDFSDDTLKECQGSSKRRIMFSPAAKPPTGVTVVLDCAR